MKEGGIRTEFFSSALENKIDSRSSVLGAGGSKAVEVDANCRFSVIR